MRCLEISYESSSTRHAPHRKCIFCATDLHVGGRVPGGKSRGISHSAGAQLLSRCVITEHFRRCQGLERGSE